MTSVFRTVIFYIDSPFQLLQVYEYVNAYSVKNYSLIVRLNGAYENDKQLIKLIKLFKISSYRIINVNSKYKAITSMVLLFIPIVFSTHVFFGDANSAIFKLYKKFLPIGKVTLLDDGVATLSNKKENLLYHRFSLFPSVISNCTENNFNYLSKSFNASYENDVNLIIGGKLVEENICSQNSYFSLISKMISKLHVNNKPIIYIAHRGESDENLLALEQKFRLNIRRLDFPIELVANELQANPIIIATVLSTAVFSMSKIYPKSKFYLCEPDPEILIKRKLIIINLFRYFKEYNVGKVFN